MTAGLRAVLESAQAEAGCSAADLTVLSNQVDPYRLDTPTGHAEGAWLAEQMERLALRRRIHLRGLHYALVASGDVMKPNGEPYRNTEKDWLWLQSSAMKSARWLGYVPFDQITDERNSPPVIRVREVSTPTIEIGLGAEVEISVPEIEDIRPTVFLSGFGARQAYRLVLTGEKTSLAEVVAPIAERRDADLYLPSGEMSDTLVYQMARTGAEDGRPMAVHGDGRLRPRRASDGGLDRAQAPSLPGSALPGPGVRGPRDRAERGSGPRARPAVDSAQGDREAGAIAGWRSSGSSRPR